MAENPISPINPTQSIEHITLETNPTNNPTSQTQKIGLIERITEESPYKGGYKAKIGYDGKESLKITGWEKIGNNFLLLELFYDSQKGMLIKVPFDIVCEHTPDIVNAIHKKLYERAKDFLKDCKIIDKTRYGKKG